MAQIPCCCKWHDFVPFYGRVVFHCVYKPHLLNQAFVHVTTLNIKTSYSQGVPIVAQWLTNPTRDHEVTGLIPGLAQWVGDLALL